MGRSSQSHSCLWSDIVAKDGETYRVKWLGGDEYIGAEGETFQEVSVEELFPTGSKVIVSGRYGQVAGHSNGKVNVRFPDAYTDLYYPHEIVKR